MVVLENIELAHIWSKVGSPLVCWRTRSIFDFFNFINYFILWVLIFSLTGFSMLITLAYFIKAMLFMTFDSFYHLYLAKLWVWLTPKVLLLRMLALLYVSFKSCLTSTSLNNFCLSLRALENISSFSSSSSTSETDTLFAAATFYFELDLSLKLRFSLNAFLFLPLSPDIFKKLRF